MVHGAVVNMPWRDPTRVRFRASKEKPRLEDVWRWPASIRKEYAVVNGPPNSTVLYMSKAPRGTEKPAAHVKCEAPRVVALN